MRQLLYTAIQESSVLASLAPATPSEPGPVRLYQLSSLGTGTIPEKPLFPFMLYSEQPSRTFKPVRETAPGTSLRTFFVYCYDQHGQGYLRIEQVLNAVRDTLLPLTGQKSPSGALCSDVVWTGWSIDSRDPEYVANIKWSIFTFLSNQ